MSRRRARPFVSESSGLRRLTPQCLMGRVCRRDPPRGPRGKDVGSSVRASPRLSLTAGALRRGRTLEVRDGSLTFEIWRPAVGAGGRGFKSRRPDENSLSEYVFLYLTRSRRSQIRPREPQGNTRNDEPNGNDPPTTSCTPLLAPPLSRGAGQVSRTV